MGCDPPHWETLGGFHHQVKKWIAGKQPWKRADRIWKNPPLTEAMQEAGLEELETYISRRQNTMVH